MLAFYFHAVLACILYSSALDLKQSKNSRLDLHVLRNESTRALADTRRTAFSDNLKNHIHLKSQNPFLTDALIEYFSDTNKAEKTFSTSAEFEDMNLEQPQSAAKGTMDVLVPGGLETTHPISWWETPESDLKIEGYSLSDHILSASRIVSRDLHDDTLRTNEGKTPLKRLNKALFNDPEKVPLKLQEKTPTKLQQKVPPGELEKTTSNRPTKVQQKTYAETARQCFSVVAQHYHLVCMREHEKYADCKRKANNLHHQFLGAGPASSPRRRKTMVKLNDDFHSMSGKSQMALANAADAFRSSHCLTALLEGDPAAQESPTTGSTKVKKSSASSMKTLESTPKSENTRTIPKKPPRIPTKQGYRNKPSKRGPALEQFQKTPLTMSKKSGEIQSPPTPYHRRLERNWNPKNVLSPFRRHRPWPKSDSESEPESPYRPPRRRPRPST